MNVVIDAGEVRSCFEVDIRNDFAFEKAENFSIAITAVEENVHLYADALIVSIQDDDCKLLISGL
jgi:hypothetical protein